MNPLDLVTNLSYNGYESQKITVGESTVRVDLSSDTKQYWFFIPKGKRKRMNECLSQILLLDNTIIKYIDEFKVPHQNDSS